METITNKKLINPIWLTLVLLLSTSLVFADQPSNAALDYCKASLLHKTPDNSVSDMIEKLLQNKIEPNQQIRQYVDDNFDAIKIATRAAETPNCDFQFHFSDGLDMQMPCVFGCIGLSKAALVNAKVLEAEGDYIGALELCLSVRKIGRHLNHQSQTMCQLIGVKINKYANNCMQNILGKMPEDPQALELLQNQLVQIDKLSFSLKPSVYVERKVWSTYMTSSRVDEISLEGLAVESFLKDIAKERVAVADEEFFARNRMYWEKHIDTLISALDLPYAQAFAEMKKESLKAANDAIENPDATLAALFTPHVYKSLNTTVNGRTHSNAIGTAVAVYLIKAKTGKLPDKLPEGLPKDLFSGKNFEYEKTEDDFILRCQDKDLLKDKIHEYKFKVKR